MRVLGDPGVCRVVPVDEDLKDAATKPKRYVYRVMGDVPGGWVDQLVELAPVGNDDVVVGQFERADDDL